MIIRIFAAIVVLISGTALGQDGSVREWFARERTYDVVHYRLTLQFDEQKKSCEGDALVRLVPLRPQTADIRLDAGNLNVSRVTLGRQNLRFETVAETLIIHLDRYYGTADTIDLVVTYAALNPAKGLYFIDPDSATPGRLAQIWSQGQPEDNHFWFPCYDYPNDRASAELIATVNEKFTVIGNGTLLGVRKDTRRKTATYHWYQKQPVPSYLISMVAGEYAEVRDSSGPAPIVNYVYRRDVEHARLSFGSTPAIMKLFADRTGVPYPWDKYSQTVIQDFMFSGMENVSAATLNDETIHDEHAHLTVSSDDLVAHELAHQWWGNYLTYRDWSQSWLSEGFATYFENLFREESRGRDDAAKSLYDAGQGYTTADLFDMRRPTVTRWYAKPSDLYDSRIYAKGAWILHMLRFYLGDELFFTSLRAYARKHAMQCVETNDFKIAIEEATGFNLHWFFDQWVYGAGYPDLDVATTWSQNTRQVTLRVRQVQHVDSLTGYFSAPVDVEVWVNGSPTSYRIWLSGAAQTFEFPAYQQPQVVIFDKGNHLLKRIFEHKSLDEWVFQLKHASEGIDRYLAVDALQWVVDTPRVADALRWAALEDRFWEVRRTSVLALADAHTPAMGDSLVAAYGDRDARVRAAVMVAARSLRNESLQRVLQIAFERDPSTSVAAEALAGLVEFDSTGARESCLRGLGRTSYKNEIVLAALRGLARLRDDASLEILRTNAGPGHSRDVRLESMRLIGASYKNHDGAVDVLVSLLPDPLLKIRLSAIAALAETRNERAIDPLETLAKTSPERRIASAAAEALERLKTYLEN